MDWQQKLSAIQAFAGRVELIMREPGKWYVSSGMSIGGNGLLVGKCGEGETPEAAVEAHWQIYCEKLPRDRYAVSSVTQGERRARWNGFMWRELTKEEIEAVNRVAA